MDISSRLQKMGMVKFETLGDQLHIDGKHVVKAWESYTGWYWFGTERSHKQDSFIDGRVYEQDQVWYGLVQGMEEEWGYWSEAELNLLKPKVWEIKGMDLPHAGRR